MTNTPPKPFQRNRPFIKWPRTLFPSGAWKKRSINIQALITSSAKVKSSQTRALSPLFSLPLLFGLAFGTTGCFSPYEPGEVLKETHYDADTYKVTEEVQFVSQDWLDDTLYQRVYVVQAEGKEIATFKGEETYWTLDSNLVESPPKKVGDWLAVFSLDRVWIWHPEAEIIAFDPIISLESNVWTKNQMEKPDFWDFYWASDFQIVDNKWILEYTDVGSRDESLSSIGPEKYHFVSEDQGKTFIPSPDWQAPPGK